MGTISYQLKPAYSANYSGGVIRLDDARSYDVKAALTAGAGTILADDTDTPLIAALDNYLPLQRTGSSNTAALPSSTRRVPIYVDVVGNGVAGQVPELQSDGTWKAVSGVDLRGDNTRPPLKAQQGHPSPRGLSKVNTASPPTVTLGAINGASTLTGSVRIALNDSRLRVLGFDPIAMTGTHSVLFRADVLTDPLGMNGMAVDRPARSIPGGAAAIEFEYDGQAFEFLANSAGALRFRVHWDNLDGLGWQAEQLSTWQSRNPAGSSSGGEAPHKIDFGSRAVRRIRVEWAGGYVGGIRIAATEAAWSPSYPKGPRVVWMGDSITEGTVSGGSYVGSAGHLANWTLAAARILGWHDMFAAGVGSTGYVSNGTTGNAVFRITINPTPTAGSWKLTCKVPGSNVAQDTATLAYNATAGQVQTALEAIYGVGNVTATGSFPGNIDYTLTGTLAGKEAELPIFTVVSTLTGSAGFGVFPQGTGGTRTRFSPRVAHDVIAQNPDIVVWAGGINDRDFTNASIYPAGSGTAAAVFRAEVDACLGAVAAALPKCRQIVLGPWSPSSSQASSSSSSQNTMAVRSALQAAAAAYGAIYIDNNVEPWITGTGKVGSTNGSGNADIYTGSDGTHPSDAGHEYMGRRFAAAVQALMPVA